METESLVCCLKLSFTFSLGSKNEGKGCVCVCVCLQPNGVISVAFVNLRGEFCL